MVSKVGGVAASNSKGVIPAKPVQGGQGAAASSSGVSDASANAGAKGAGFKQVLREVRVKQQQQAQRPAVDRSRNDGNAPSRDAKTPTVGGSRRVEKMDKPAAAAARTRAPRQANEGREIEDADTQVAAAESGESDELQAEQAPAEAKPVAKAGRPGKAAKGGDAEEDVAAEGAAGEAEASGEEDLSLSVEPVMPEILDDGSADVAPDAAATGDHAEGTDADAPAELTLAAMALAGQVPAEIESVEDMTPDVQASAAAETEPVAFDTGEAEIDEMPVRTGDARRAATRYGQVASANAEPSDAGLDDDADEVATASDFEGTWDAVPVEDDAAPAPVTKAPKAARPSGDAPHRVVAKDEAMGAQEKPSATPAANPEAVAATPQPVADVPQPMAAQDVAKPAATLHETVDAVTASLGQHETKAAANAGTAGGANAAAKGQAAPRAPEAQFAEANHATIVSGVKGELLPGGGTMQIRLDPEHLGPLNVTVQVTDGVVSASFQTQNDEATKLLSHSLAQLKHVLEQAGVSVDRLQVQQANPKEFARQEKQDGQSSQQQQQQGQGGLDDRSAKQEQQRREMIDRMWEKIAMGRVRDVVDVKV